MKLQLRGLCLLLLAQPLVGLAQETPLEEGVSAGKDVAGLDHQRKLAVPAEDRAAERDQMEPRLASDVLVADYKRSTVGNRVMDEMDLARTEITGNQELPKVLYIVPWKKSDPGDLMGRPVNTLLDEVLAPIDRSEFIRQVGYYGDLYGQDDE